MNGKFIFIFCCFSWIFQYKNWLLFNICLLKLEELNIEECFVRYLLVNGWIKWLYKYDFFILKKVWFLFKLDKLIIVMFIFCGLFFFLDMVRFFSWLKMWMMYSVIFIVNNLLLFLIFVFDNDKSYVINVVMWGLL